MIDYADIDIPTWIRERAVIGVGGIGWAVVDTDPSDAQLALQYWAEHIKSTDKRAPRAVVGIDMALEEGNADRFPIR